MRQALHIFKKDVRYLRYELSLVVLFAGAFAAMHLRATNGLLNQSWLPEIFWFIGVASLLGRLLLAEAIPGDRQFWITRPYRWKSLLGAKLLFIVAFVNLPIFLVHVIILIIDGFPLASSVPGLLWSQLLLFTFLLPFAAFATLSNAKPFLMILFCIAAAIWELSMSGDAGALTGVAWVGKSIALIALFAPAIVILLIQYQSRRTVLSRWVAAGGITVSALVFVALPWPVAFAIESRLAKQNALGSSIQAGLSRTFEEQFWAPRITKQRVALHIPVSVQGIPDGTEVQPDALSVLLQGPDGRVAELGPADCVGLKRGSISANAATISALCVADPAFFQAQRGRPVRLRASLYFTLFGNTRSQTIPLSNEPSNTLDGLQCYTDPAKAEWDVYCRSAFRWPARLVYAKLGHTNANSFTQLVSYSPFPASLNIDPIETRWASAYAYGPAPNVSDVTIIAEEPLAHLRCDFEANDVQLDRFVYPPVKVGPLPIHAIP
jgi:hypothetical protein